MSVFSNSVPDGDRTISIETGNWAKQAHGSIVYRTGEHVLLATVCAERDARDGQDFFPLTIEYREKFYARGRIPGGFFKREGRATEQETLMCRLIDRPIRPLFPEGYFSEVQLIVNLLSGDPDVAVEGHAITAASAALMASDIPFDGPIAGVLVGRIDGQFVADPGFADREKSDLDLLVAGSKDAITMIEGGAKEYSQDEILAALEFAHKAIQHKLELQQGLVAKMQPAKREVKLRLPDPDLMQQVRAFALDKMAAANQNTDKMGRSEGIQNVYKETVAHFEKPLREAGAENIDQSIKDIKNELHEVEFEVVRSLILDKGIRADGRKTDEIRAISVELDVLPGAHGSAVFTRGQTQSLGVTTLGTLADNQRIENIYGQDPRYFMLHYNFPPYSTGEVKRMMGPGRREIGHGNLAWRALKQVLPNQEEFPYTIRIVSEIMESNGSSSMATVCAGSLSMMTAGVPVTGPVSGIAMGMMSDDSGRFAILSDIAGIEDHFGDMDFKIAGTAKGITTFQLDLKLKGISIERLRVALEQAEKGRLYILEKMNAVLDVPRANVAENAPRIISMKIDQDRIGELIGPGGKIIRSIMEKASCEINVEDDGTVQVAAVNTELAQKAVQMIEDLFRDILEGEQYEGIVRRIVDFGAFVEILPGKEGLLHISKMANERVMSVRDHFTEGDSVPVVVLGVDRNGRIDLAHQDVDLSAKPGRSEHSDRGGNRGGGRSGGPNRSGGRSGGGRGHRSRN
ncbi:MAG: polyribonucleotide nucleotidyltransferase [Leptospiraceae bacterium]|nr:polyribonucleotide nucleotidyltransferase [Leptospiraceae bacterium]